LKNLVRSSHYRHQHARDDGLDLVRALRTAECKFTPVLVLTTEAGAEMKEQGKAAGATGWIVKPFNPEVLLSVLKKVLN
jgi:two-component system chemotaxis response regulator CheY